MPSRESRETGLCVYSNSEMAAAVRDADELIVSLGSRCLLGAHCSRCLHCTMHCARPGPVRSDGSPLIPGNRRIAESPSRRAAHFAESSSREARPRDPARFGQPWGTGSWSIGSRRREAAQSQFESQFQSIRIGVDSSRHRNVPIQGSRLGWGRVSGDRSASPRRFKAVLFSFRQTISWTRPLRGSDGAKRSCPIFGKGRIKRQDRTRRSPIVRDLGPCDYGGRGAPGRDFRISGRLNRTGQGIRSPMEDRRPAAFDKKGPSDGGVRLPWAEDKTALLLS